jgi:ribosomal protein L24E
MYKRPKGTTVVNSASGEIYHFCSSKCRKYADMKRKKKKWTDRDLSFSSPETPKFEQKAF